MEAALDGDVVKPRMAHVRLDPETHRRVRIVAASQDTSVQDWLARTVEEAIAKTWPEITNGSLKR